jgi:hypothetical protein
MLLFGVLVKWQSDCFSELNRTVLRKLWDVPPTDEQLQETIEDWALRVMIALDEGRSIMGLGKIVKVSVIDFDLEFADIEALRSRLDSAHAEAIAPNA